MTQFDVAVSPTGQAVVLRLAGEFDIAAIEEFERAIEVSMDGAAAQLVVDLRGVRFMDSSGLKAILAASGRAARSGGTLRIVPGSKSVTRVFEMTNTLERLEFVPPSQVDDPMAENWYG